MNLNVRRTIQIGLAAGAAMLILATTGAPALAVNKYAYLHPNYGSINTADNYWFEACDMAANGVGVYIDLKLYDTIAPPTPNGPLHYYYWDSNGAAGGCKNGNAPHYGTRTWGWIAVCEDRDRDGYAGTISTRDSGDTCSAYGPIQ